MEDKQQRKICVFVCERELGRLRMIATRKRDKERKSKKDRKIETRH